MGVQRGIAKRASTDRAENNLKFYTYAANFGAINNSNPITISIGEFISTTPIVAGDPSITYKVTETTVLDPLLNEGFVSVESVSPGINSRVGSNSLVSHNFTNYVDSANNSLLVTNISPIQNGDDDESDESYRFRISKSSTSAEAANLTAIRLGALSVPGVADIKTLNYFRGVGTADILVRSFGRTVTSLVNAVQQVIDQVKAYGNDITVRAPEQTGIEIFLTIKYRPGTNNEVKIQTENAVFSSLREYLNSLEIAESFIINEAVQRVMDQSTSILDIGTPGTPFDSIFIYKDSPVLGARIKSTLLGNYTPESDEKLIPEPSVLSPITIRRIE